MTLIPTETTIAPGKESPEAGRRGGGKAKVIAATLLEIIKQIVGGDVGNGIGSMGCGKLEIAAGGVLRFGEMRSSVGITGQLTEECGVRFATHPSGGVLPDIGSVPTQEAKEVKEWRLLF